MNFKDWMIIEQLFNELGDVFTADLSNVRLTPTPLGYEYDFDVDGKRFTVYFVQQHLPGSEANNLPDVDLTGYEIIFQGPKALASTNEMGTKASKVYSQVLLATRALLDQAKTSRHPAQFLSWSPAEPKMGLIYDKFYKRFLADKFTLVKPGTVVDKGVLAAHMDSMPTGAAILLNKAHQQAQQANDTNLYYVKLHQQKDARTRRLGGTVWKPAPKKKGQ